MLMYFADVIAVAPRSYPLASSVCVGVEGQYAAERIPSGAKKRSRTRAGYGVPVTLSRIIPSSTYPVLLYRNCVPGGKSRVSFSTYATSCAGVRSLPQLVAQSGLAVYE